MKDKIIYWLEQLYDAVMSLKSQIGVSAQSDWSEVDNTEASYIKNKPSIPAGAVAIAGAVSEGAFTPTSADFSTTLEHITGGYGMVYLTYTVDSETVYDLIVKASASEMVSALNVTWEAPGE